MNDTTAPKPPDLHRYKLIVAYNGSRFKGFQRQSSGAAPESPEEHNTMDTMDTLAWIPESPSMKLSDSPRKRHRDEPHQKNNRSKKKKKVLATIQESLEDALESYSGLHRRNLCVRFAGRTDGGVHARGQVVAVSLPYSKDELWMIRRNINTRLPEDISVDDISSLADWPDFDPRKDTVRKRYSYTLKFRRKTIDASGTVLPVCLSGPNTIRSGVDPKTQWTCPWTLDDSKMRMYCHQLTGEHDYSAFVQRQSRRENSNVLTVESFDYEVLDDKGGDAPVVIVRFQVIAKGFRRGMVRNLVGFVVDLCRGHVSETVFESIWNGTDEVGGFVHSAPPFGLCLEHVEYPSLPLRQSSVQSPL
jgi:tRNA pseudouridine38-40 synthase